MSESKALAVRLAEKGYKVFPTRLKWDEDGIRLTTPKIYYNHEERRSYSWEKDGSEDPARVEELFSECKGANTAFIDCAGLVVVDCDVKPKVDAEGNVVGRGDGINQYCQAAGIDPDWPADDPRAPYVTTKTGGRHYFYRADPEHPVKNVSGQFDEDVDTKSAHNPVFMYGEPALSVADLPMVPEVVWQRVPLGKTKQEMAAEEEAEEGSEGDDKYLVKFDKITRDFTMRQAWSEKWIVGALDALEAAQPKGVTLPDGSKSPGIESIANTTACILSHFGPEFFPKRSPEELFLEAIYQTAYDGPGSGKRKNKGSTPWTHYRFLRIISGEEEIEDPWRAVLKPEKEKPASTKEPTDGDDLDERLYAYRMASKRVDRRIADEEFSKHAIVLESASLEQMLADPDIVEAPFRVGNLSRIGYNTTITAQYKTGKSHLAANLAKAFSEDSLFLDEFEVRRPAGNIGFINYELTAADLVTWFRKMDIRNTERIFPLNLRGKKFSLVSERYQEELIKWCLSNDIEVLVLDPHRRAFAGFGKENDNDDVNAFTDVLDYVKEEANVSDLFLTVHTGRAEQEEGEEHARGAAAIDDWADSRWVMTKKDKDRFMYASGRMGDVREFGVEYDEETHLLTYKEGDRRTSGVNRYKEPLFLLIRASGDRGLNKTEMYRRMASQGFKFAEGGRKAELNPATDELVAEGRIQGRKHGTSQRYWITENCPPVDDTYKAL